MSKANETCKNCKYRRVGCHSGCEVYAEIKREKIRPRDLALEYEVAAIGMAKRAQR